MTMAVLHTGGWLRFPDNWGKKMRFASVKTPSARRGWYPTPGCDLSQNGIVPIQLIYSYSQGFIVLFHQYSGVICKF